MGYGAPGGPYWIYPKYRAALEQSAAARGLLVRHPKMRVYVMHAGMPMVDEMIMVMNAHPQVFVDIAADNWGVPRKEFHFILKRLVDAGYGKRIMFGSDQMVWPRRHSGRDRRHHRGRFPHCRSKSATFYTTMPRASFA